MASDTEREGQSFAREVDGPWMNTDALNKVPQVRREFDMNRDPAIRAQLRDQEKTEAQRRGEQSGKGSSMVERDQSKPTFRPSGELGKAGVRSKYNKEWMAEQRSAAFANARKARAAPEQRPHQRNFEEPSR